MQHDESGSKLDLMQYRLETAKEALNDAELLFVHGSYKAANNRAYYAIYHAVSAVHALSGKAYKRHKDAIANFNKDYVKTGIFASSLGRKIAMAERIRNASDYDDFYIARKTDVRQQIDDAKEVLAEIENYCSIGKTSHKEKEW